MRAYAWGGVCVGLLKVHFLCRCSNSRWRSGSRSARCFFSLPFFYHSSAINRTSEAPPQRDAHSVSLTAWTARCESQRGSPGWWIWTFWTQPDMSAIFVPFTQTHTHASKASGNFQNFLTTFASYFYNLNRNNCSFILPIPLPGQTTWHPQCNLATNSWAGDRGEEAGHVASSHQTSSPPSVCSSAPTDVTQVTSLEAFYRESQAALFTILFPDTLDVSHWWTSGYVCVCKRSDSKVNPPLSLHFESHAESWLAH